jgi:large subunit ribosomal protein L10
MAHVAQWKKQYVDELVTSIMEKPVIGLVNIHGIPAKQMQSMRANIRENMNLRGSKNTLIKLALERAAAEGKTNVESLIPFIDGQCALVSTDLNPFKLAKEFDATLTPTPAKGGDIAPEDIIVKKGETQFKPGPMVSEFTRAGLPAGIDKGKIMIKKNTTLVKKGEEISREAAGALTKLEIFPMSVGLDLRAAWDDGTIFDAEALKVDEEQILGQVKFAAIQALNLAVFAGYPTGQTIVPLVQKAFSQAMSLAISAGYSTPETIPLLLAKAQGQLLALASLLDPESLDEGIQGLLSSTAIAASASAVASAPQETSEPEEDEEEEEEVTEEEAAAGLGALFG